MTKDDRFEIYAESLAEPASPYLADLRKRAEAEGVPIIRRGTEPILQTLLLTKRPETILEIGCAVGYSALFMHQVLPEAEITTLELDPDRADLARRHFQEAGSDGAISLVQGEAGLYLSQNQRTFDLIFLDAAKGQYLTWLPDIKRAMAPGGLLLADNILQEGDILESHFAVERRNRTIHKRMREFLHALTHDAELSTALLSQGDGLSVTVKK